MEYKSKFILAIKLQEKILKEKRREIGVIVSRKNEIEQKIAKEIKKEEELKNQLKEQSMDAVYFMSIIDGSYIENNRKILEEVNLELKVKKIEYEKIKKKKEMLEKMDEQRMIEFFEEKERKEEKELEDAQVIKQIKNKRR